MKLSKKTLFLITLISGVLFVKAPSYILPLTLDDIYQSDEYDVNLRETCKYTVILISNPPFTKRGMEKLWMNEKENIINIWNPLVKECDRIYFIRNNLERLHDSEQLKYWMGDYQICLRGQFKDKCISNDNIFLKISFRETLNKNEFPDKYGDKTIYVSYRE